MRNLCVMGTNGKRSISAVTVPSVQLLMMSGLPLTPRVSETMPM